MRLVGEERREFQRLRLDPPVTGTVGGLEITILEIGVLGARICHTDPLPAYGELRFSSGTDEIAMKCEAVRTLPSPVTKYGEPEFETGVRFLAAVEDSGDKLRDMLGRLVQHEFEVRRQMPANSIPHNPSSVDGDRTVRGSDAAFLCYRLENGKWSKRRVFLPEQPTTGFTVARAEDSTEMQRLCTVYEASDEEGRRLIRLFAELSVSDALEIPPRL
ncbi:MAG TPA: hypothetical protein VLV78_12545 [Thermoanaerobaculia bacterium]|nr:hypothetical protein [Thermoanaerobaculia bacterium]